MDHADSDTGLEPALQQLVDRVQQARAERRSLCIRTQNPLAFHDSHRYHRAYSIAVPNRIACVPLFAFAEYSV